MLYLRALLAVVLLPGTVTLLVPWILLRVVDARAGFGPFRKLGVPLIVAGAMIGLWCIWDFARRGRGTLAAVDPPKELVRQGLYRCVRNPMYLGVLGVLLGEAFHRGAPVLLLWAVFMGLLFNLSVFFYEEPALKRMFGEPYEAYCREVPRWIPRMSPWRS